MGSELKQIKCRKLLSKNPKESEFGKVCECTLAQLDGEGRLLLTCPGCGNVTALTVRDVVPASRPSQISLGSAEAEEIREDLRTYRVPPTLNKGD
jgi:hypothetical protein